MIWCVEDDANIRDIALYALRSSGFEAEGFPSGDACWDALQNGIPDLILLDVMMPGMDGVELLKRIRSSPSLSQIPVIMATAKGSEYDKIQGLELGADDYLVKPYGILEMVSRVKAVLRRCKPAPSSHLLRAGAVCLDSEAHIVTVDGQRITLTYKEYELLHLFLSHPGVAFSRDRLFTDIWGMNYIGETRTVDMHIRTLRQKLGDSGAMIQTVRGVGYRLEEPK